MKVDLTMYDLLLLHCSLCRTISDMEEAKIHDHQLYGEKYDEIHERTIQACTKLAGRIRDMLEDQER